MKIWHKCALFICLCLISASPFTVYVHAASNSEVKAESVLLLYDSLAIDTAKAGNLDALKRLLVSFGVQVTVETFDDYKQGTLNGFNKVIGLQNRDELQIVNANYLNDFDAYTGDYMQIGTQIPDKVKAKLGLQIESVRQEWVDLSIQGWQQTSIYVETMSWIIETKGETYGSLTSDSRAAESPFAVRSDGYVYVPFYEQGNLTEIALGYVLRDWLNQQEEFKGYYLLFKEIYPFSDLELLKQLADRLYSAGIPFIASVRPVFSNTDYPAMERYMKALKYVQSRNGSILVNAPIVTANSHDKYPDMQAQMETFIDVLADYGIAPLGIGAEMYWSYDKEYSDYGMVMFDSAVLFPNEKIVSRNAQNTSKPFFSTLHSLQPELLEQFSFTSKFQPEFPMSTVVTFDLADNAEQLDQQIQVLREYWVSFSDYKDAVHTVRTQTHIISSANGLLTINDQSVNMTDSSKDITEDYMYRQEEKKSFVTLFQIQNQIFIVLILITLVLFGFLFHIGRKLYKRKYMDTNRRREL